MPERKRSVYHDAPSRVDAFYAALSRHGLAVGVILFIAAVCYVAATVLGNDSQHVEYDQMILFGDSLLQRSLTQEHGFAFGAQVADDYIRKLDVVNRGFNGYSSAQALHVLPQIMPRATSARVRFLVIFLGANDAALETYHTGQHISIDQYQSNLKQIIRHPMVRAHRPRILLITPPPVNEHQLLQHEKAQGREDLGRTAQGVKEYAMACVDVARDLGIPVLDIWSLMMEEVGWHSHQVLFGSLEQRPDTKLAEFLSDGLHFSPAGYRFLHEHFMRLIARTWPDQTPEALEELLPPWEEAFPAPIPVPQMSRPNADG